MGSCSHSVGLEGAPQPHRAACLHRTFYLDQRASAPYPAQNQRTPWGYAGGSRSRMLPNVLEDPNVGIKHLGFVSLELHF